MRIPMACAVALLVAACGGAGERSAPDGGAATAGPVTVTLLAHDAFALDSALVERLRERTGIALRVVAGGDAGVLVNRAVLSAGRPEGDVLFGVDTTLLSRAVRAGVFEPYRSAAWDDLSSDLTETVPDDAVTPVDYGDVCVNVDDAWFQRRGLAPPRTLDDLADPRYRDLLVVENPATSSPGLAFLLATVARYGDDGYLAYWERLRDNGVQVVNDWTTAYTGEFSGGGQGGARPLVVSYASSPPAQIVFAPEPKPAEPSTTVMTDGCFRQVEYAGVLAGTAQPAAARAVVDWLVSPEVQASLPLSMFVFPARSGTPLPEVFSRFAARVPAPLSLPTDRIDADRERWIDAWTSTVLA